MTIMFDFTARLIVAMALGGLIGMERDYRAKDAGFRTHFLVALGSALFCLVSQYGFGMELKDSSRVAAQVVSGIGFLGAGTIIFQKNMVRGLTTAAGLWVTAAIGLACGTGMYAAACITTILMLIGLELFSTYVPRLAMVHVNLSFITTNGKEGITSVLDKLRSEGAEVVNYSAERTSNNTPNTFAVQIEVRLHRRHSVDHLLDYMRKMDDITVTQVE